MRPGRQAADDGSFARSVGAHTVRGAALIGIAVVLGFVLLNKIDHNPGVPSAARLNIVTSTTRETVPPASTSTTRAPDQVKVLVANGTHTDGVAGQAAGVIKAAGYNTLASVTATPVAINSQRATTIYYAAGYDNEAKAIAQLLALTPAPAAVPMPATGLPVSDVKGANVLVQIGPDYVAAHPATTTHTSTARPTTTSTTRRL